MKRPRRLVPSRPAESKSPVQQAVDRVIGQTDEAAPALRPVSLVTYPSALRLRSGGHLELSGSPAEGVAVMFIQQGPQPWLAITLPPGSTWVLREKQPEPADPLWVPPGAGRMT